MDLLRHRQEAVTVLDMVAVRRLPPTLALLLADLRNLRTLALRVDLVPFILGDSMTQLEVLTLELRAGSSPSRWAHTESEVPCTIAEARFLVTVANSAVAWSGLVLPAASRSCPPCCARCPVPKSCRI